MSGPLIAVLVVEDRRVTRRGHLAVVPLADGTSLLVALARPMQIPRELLVKPSAEMRQAIESWLKSKKEPHALGTLTRGTIGWISEHKAWLPESHPALVVLGTREPLPFFDTLVRGTSPEILARMLAASSLEVEPKALAARAAPLDDEQTTHRGIDPRRSAGAALIGISSALAVIALFVMIDPFTDTAGELPDSAVAAVEQLDAGETVPLVQERSCPLEQKSACWILGLQYPTLARYCENAAADIRAELDQATARACAIERRSPSDSVAVWEAREARAREVYRAIAAKAFVKNVVGWGGLKTHTDALKPTTAIGPKTITKGLKQAKIATLPEADAKKLAAELSLLSKGIPSQADLIISLGE